ncbi:hypothetical protein [Pseudomonas ekonensis]|uniref:hypothetical protein n=1 Tax=Pseudomonas ekonensis TaxID=2842353 RepID=UPI0034624277
MQDAAGRLLGQALTSGARHLAFGMARVRFTQQVARYAKRIADEVAAGHLSPEQGILALAQEQRDLLNQSRALSRSPRTARARPLSAQPAAHSDPQRLLRAVHRQNLNVSRPAAMSGPSPHPVNDLRFFPSELWPQEAPAPEEPGFYIVPESLPAEALQARLFPSPKPNVIATFKRLNPLEDMVKAGSLIVLSDPDNQQCTYEESLLMETARIVSLALEPLTMEEADFFAQHYDVIRQTLSHGSKVIGVGTAMAANHLDTLKATLKDIEALHTRTLQTNGSLNSKSFKKQRAELLKRLDGQLTQFTKKAIALPDYPNLKIALGIDHPHLVHRWRRAGGIGQVPGYATHVRAVTQASQHIKHGGWIGTAVGGGASAMKIQDVCRNGSAAECEKVRFTETASFLGGVSVGALASRILTAGATVTICAGVGIPTGGVGTLLCSALIAGAGNLAAGMLGEKGGELFAEKIYEANQ